MNKIDKVFDFYGFNEKNIEGSLPAGISAKNTLKGETVNVIQKIFITSNDDIFQSAIQLINQFCDDLFKESELNRILVIIKNDKKALIYKNYPCTIKMRIKKNNLNKGDIIYEKDVLDISEVIFEDAKVGININDGDKIIWLFREKWRFGLYLDLSGKLKKELLNKDLGSCFRYLRYYNLYNNLKNNENSQKL